MSQPTEQSEGLPDFGELVDRLGDNYQIPALVVIMAFMLWNRLRSWGNFVINGEVLYSGNDPWYHYRTVSWTVRNWPETMPFDPWTYFPFGTSSGQFGTVFDQLIATAALIVGLGNPSDHTVRMVLLFAPAVFGTLVAIPTYLIGRRLGGRLGGVFGVLILALSAGALLSRSLAGVSDHHVAEALFQATGVLGMMVAVSVAESEKPVWELVADREFDALRRPLAWGVLGGTATAFYLWVWPPGILLLGVLGVYFVAQLSLDYVHGRSPDHVAFAGAVSMTTTGVLALASIQYLGIRPNDFSLLQPLVAFGIAGTCVFMAWLAREWDDRSLPKAGYPAAVLGTFVVAAGLFAVVLPDVFGILLNNVQRVIGFQISAQAGTVGEVQSLQNPVGSLLEDYGLMFVTAALAALVVLYQQGRGTQRGEYLLVVLWAVFMTLATLTQARFGYYLTVPIVVLNAYLIGIVVRFVELPSGIGDVKGYQVLTIFAVLLVITGPLVLLPGSALEQSERNGPGLGIQGWSQSLDWMEDNTPAEGRLENPNGENLSYYGTFAQQDDYQYGAGEYGVLSWWDYGHWITTQGERIPNANPFQQGAGFAANVLLAQDEQRANELLDQQGGANESTRYVMVDWKMATTQLRGYIQTQSGLQVRRVNGKYFAPIQFYDDRNVSQSDFYVPYLTQQGQNLRPVVWNLKQQDYYDSLLTRLYQYHGSAAEVNPVVVDWDWTTTQNGQQVRTNPSGENATITRTFRSMEAARAFVEEDGSAQIGGIGAFPQERVPALEHYRLVHATSTSAAQYGYGLALQTVQFGAQVRADALLAPSNFGFSGIPSSHPAWTKTFERVEGATIQGSGAPANTTVTASVDLQIPTVNQSSVFSTFTYHQRVQTDANGEFEMTVPYSTTGYDDYGPSNGYTNVSVRATGPYRLSTPTQFGNESATLYNASVDVDESLVVGDGESSLDVTMEQQTIEFPDGNTTDGNTTEDNQTTNDTSGGAAAVGGSADSGPSDAVTATDFGTGDGDALAAAPARQTSVLLG